MVVQEEKSNGEKEVQLEGKERCRGSPVAWTDHANSLMCYRISTWVRCKTHYLWCTLGGLDFEQWPFPSGTPCYFANISIALLKAMKQQLVSNLISYQQRSVNPSPSLSMLQNRTSFLSQGKEGKLSHAALQHKQGQGGTTAERALLFQTEPIQLLDEN